MQKRKQKSIIYSGNEFSCHVGLRDLPHDKIILSKGCFEPHIKRLILNTYKLNTIALEPNLTDFN